MEPGHQRRAFACAGGDCDVGRLGRNSLYLHMEVFPNSENFQSASRGIAMADLPPEELASLPRGKPAFDQDPHRVRQMSGRSLEVAIGREVRNFRRQQGMTVADLAGVTGLSIGMLSKIENGNTSPSLTTLRVLSHAFSVPVTAFFKSYEERREAQHVKSGTHLEIERRGTRAGHQYNLLGHIGSNASGVVVEPYIITLTTESDTFPTFQHEGLELIYMLEGEDRKSVV